MDTNFLFVPSSILDLKSQMGLARPNHVIQTLTDLQSEYARKAGQILSVWEARLWQMGFGSPPGHSCVLICTYVKPAVRILFLPLWYLILWWAYPSCLSMAHLGVWQCRKSRDCPVRGIVRMSFSCRNGGGLEEVVFIIRCSREKRGLSRGTRSLRWTGACIWFRGGAMRKGGDDNV